MTIENGALCFWRTSHLEGDIRIPRVSKQLVHAFPAEKWNEAWAADVLTGYPLAIDWDQEISA
jgi:hypothetical protein